MQRDLHQPAPAGHVCNGADRCIQSLEALAHPMDRLAQVRSATMTSSACCDRYTLWGLPAFMQLFGIVQTWKTPNHSHSIVPGGLPVMS